MAFQPNSHSSLQSVHGSKGVNVGELVLLLE